MIDGVIVKSLNKIEDTRGYLMEFYRDDEVDYRSAMGYLSITKPNVIRGPHEHQYQSDYFIFPGPGKFKLFLWDRREDSVTNGQAIVIEAGADEPKAVVVPPGVVHGYKCVSEMDGFSINLPDKLYRGKNKVEEVDEIRWEEDENSPYVIN